MALSHIDKNTALQVFAVANTPLFLLRKLRAHPVVDEIQKYHGREILSALRRSVRKRPSDLNDFASPYLYLMAIAAKQDLALLQQAADLPAPYHDWYSIIANMLIMMFRVTSVSRLEVANAIPTPNVTFATSVPSTIANLQIKRVS
jgi:hypothetical protein